MKFTSTSVINCTWSSRQTDRERDKQSQWSDVIIIKLCALNSPCLPRWRIDLDCLTFLCKSVETNRRRRTNQQHTCN